MRPLLQVMLALLLRRLWRALWSQLQRQPQQRLPAFLEEAEVQLVACLGLLTQTQLAGTVPRPTVAVILEAPLR